MGGINDYIRIGQKMKHIREVNGISQKEMAERLSIAQSSYSNYENENREPSFALICKFCEQFGMNVDDIIRSEIKVSKKEFEGNEPFPDRLKKFRVEKGITQSELANSLGVSQNAVYNWENGRREPNLCIIRQIAEILNTTILELIGEECELNRNYSSELEMLRKENEELKRQREMIIKILEGKT